MARALMEEAGELRGDRDGCRPGADDEHIHLVGDLGGAVDPESGGRLDARVAGHVAPVVDLHVRLLKEVTFSIECLYNCD